MFIWNCYTHQRKEGQDKGERCSTIKLDTRNTPLFFSFFPKTNKQKICLRQRLLFAVGLQEKVPQIVTKARRSRGLEAHLAPGWGSWSCLSPKWLASVGQGDESQEFSKVLGWVWRIKWMYDLFRTLSCWCQNISVSWIPKLPSNTNSLSLWQRWACQCSGEASEALWHWVTRWEHLLLRQVGLPQHINPISIFQLDGNLLKLSSQTLFWGFFKSIPLLILRWWSLEISYTADGSKTDMPFLKTGNVYQNSKKIQMFMAYYPLFPFLGISPRNNLMWT